MTRLLRSALLSLVFGLPAWADGPAKPAVGPARIALLSDLHVTAMTNAELVASHRRLHQAIDDVNAAQVDLVLIAGDLTEWGSPQELARLRDHLMMFSAPVWVVPGNHDVGNKFTDGKTNAHPVTAWHARLYESWLGPSFFARTRAGVRVIGINSAIIGSGLPREQKMWVWLEKELAKTNALPTLLLTHYPPFEKKADEKSHEYWNINAPPRARLLDWLKKAGVNAVLSGHLHRDLTNRYEGILLLTTRPVSFGLPKEKQPEGWTLITVPAEGPVRTEPRVLKR
jgi:3',5'-cyclic AMP phosphodiesterase CpdA